MLAIANFCSTVVFSCIAPFFPSEAKKKGVSQTVIGLIFGIFELCIFFTSPLYGRYMTHIGSKFMYGAGLFVTGVTSILFGLLNMSPPGGTFIGLCFAVRICEAFGDAAFITASFAIIAHEFPGRTSTIILGGFQLPFIVLGCFLFLAGGLSIPLIPKQDDAPRHEVGGVFGLFRIPAVALMCSAIIVCAICLSFLDPTFENHLKDFNLGALLVGFMFLSISGPYTIAAPLWGYFMDKTGYTREVMVVGALGSAVGMFFLGPSPLSHLNKTLWIIILSEVILGVAIGALFIPTFQNSLIIAKGFLGPTVFGGAIAGSIGFEWTATILAGFNVIVVKTRILNLLETIS